MIIINDCTVYIHKNKTNNKVYIGITGINPKSRWGSNGSGYNHNPHFKNAIKKYGWDGFDHIILYEHLTKEAAENKEIELIKEYNSTNMEYGYNIQNGGSSHGRMSDSIKQKISIANSIPIYQYDKITRKFIAEYYGSREAEKRLGISPEAINSVCRKVAKSIGGYIFRFKTQNLLYGQPLPDEEYEYSKNIHLAPVVQYTKDGEYVKEYPSIKDAELAFGKKQGNTLIWHCCNGKKPSAMGYIWTYKNNPCIVKQSKRSRPVDKYSMDGEFIEHFESVKDAAASLGRNSTNVLIKALKNIKPFGGFMWKYTYEKYHNK